MTTLENLSPSGLRSHVELLLRGCAKCGHALIDHEHSHTELTWCSVDMGVEQHEPCPCAAYEAQP